tara:strand:- start:535 stop:840 length:306 start_codon:yes stop_codon:yes gene_type:complete
MNYTQHANPNATTSELDAKVIIKHRTLNSFQLQILKNLYCQTIIDSMDYKDMEQFVYQTLQEDFDKQNQMEMKEEIELSFDAETYRELLNSIGESEEEKNN